MSRSLLGPEIDIHTGGEDLISIHHNNEIAQSEAASGRTFVHYWLHNAFLTIQGEKASKSLGNVVYLEEIRTRGIHPLALRYLFLQAHYRTPLNFSWDALLAAESALTRLWNTSRALAEETKRTSAPSEARARFLASVRDDLSTPQALGILWESLKSEEYSPEEKWGLIEDADKHLGLSLVTPPPRSEEPIPDEVQKLAKERDQAREKRDFAAADRLREEIEKRGYRVDDGPEGTVLTRATL
jgi:cysteinyl-tRNA synthetase